MLHPPEMFPTSFMSSIVETYFVKVTMTIGQTLQRSLENLTWWLRLLRQWLLLWLLELRQCHHPGQRFHGSGPMALAAAQVAALTAAASACLPFGGAARHAISDEKVWHS